jgi:hypothetical protein
MMVIKGKFISTQPTYEYQLLHKSAAIILIQLTIQRSTCKRWEILTAIAIAILLSVTVSSAEEINGKFSLIFLVNADVRSCNKAFIQKDIICVTPVSMQFFFHQCYQKSS